MKMSDLNLKSIQIKQMMINKCKHDFQEHESLGYDSNDIEAILYKCSKCGNENIEVDIDGFLERSGCEIKKSYQQNDIDNLLKGVTFKFDFLSEGIALCTSSTMVDVDEDLHYIKLEFFIEENDFLFAYQTFEDIKERFNIFRVFFKERNGEDSVIFFKTYEEN